MAAAPGASESELREVLMRAESVRQQLAMMEQQRELLGEVAGEASRSLATLEGLANAKEGEELLVPIGAGAFVHARLAQPGKAIASLGSSLHAEVSVEDAQARLRARVEGLQATSQKVSGEIHRLVEEMTRLNAILESQGA